MTTIDLIVTIGFFAVSGVIIPLFIWYCNHLSKTKRDEINMYKEAKNNEIDILKEKIGIYELFTQDIAKKKFDEFKKRVEELEKDLTDEKEISRIKEKMKNLQIQRLKSIDEYKRQSTSSPDKAFDAKIIQHCMDLLKKSDLASQLYAIRLLSVIPDDKAQALVVENLCNDNFHIRTMAMDSIIAMSMYDREKIIPKVLSQVCEGSHVASKDIIKLLKEISDKRHVELIKNTIDTSDDSVIKDYFIHEFKPEKTN